MELELNQRVLLISRWGQVFDESTVEKLTATRGTLANGWQFTLADFRAYGSCPRGLTVDLLKIALPTPDLETELVIYRDRQAAAAKLANAKSRLISHIDYMRSGGFGRCTEAQIYAALEALDAVFNGEKE